MAKFNWQNGTLVTPARVEINGEVHDVTPAQYSGQTPLSAENLIAMQDGIYEDIDANASEIDGLKYNLVDNASPILTGRKINGKDEYIIRRSLTLTGSSVVNSNRRYVIDVDVDYITPTEEIKAYIEASDIQFPANIVRFSGTSLGDASQFCYYNLATNQVFFETAGFNRDGATFVYELRFIYNQ